MDGDRSMLQMPTGPFVRTVFLLFKRGSGSRNTLDQVLRIDLRKPDVFDRFKICRGKVELKDPWQQ